MGSNPTLSANFQIWAALTAQPDIIKPNRRELEAVRREALDRESALRRALEALMKAHAVVIVSDGARGAWFASRGQILFAEAPPVKRADTTGVEP